MLTRLATKRRRKQADWHEVAKLAQARMSELHGVIVVCGAILVVLCAIGFVVAEPNREGVGKAATLVLLTGPVALLLFECWSLLCTVALQTQLIKCAEAQPVADDEEDARDVEWCLLHARWLHRLACRLRGRDYEALLQLCRNACRRDQGT